jgi:hypothetical protein
MSTYPDDEAKRRRMWAYHPNDRVHFRCQCGYEYEGEKSDAPTICPQCRRRLTDKANIDCIKEILKMYFNDVMFDPHYPQEWQNYEDKDSFSCSARRKLPSAVELWFRLTYTPRGGLNIKEIGTYESVHGILRNHQERVDVTKEYINDSFVKSLFQKINDDIKRNC